MSEITDEIRELGKREVAYDRQLAILGKKDADMVLYFWEMGYKAAVRGAREETEELKRLAHDNLPEDCVHGWGEVKFCRARQGAGNECKHCSNYLD